MRPRFIAFSLLFGVLASSTPVLAKATEKTSDRALPPLGQRRYLLGEHPSEAKPTAIKPLGAAAGAVLEAESGRRQGTFLVDPLPPGSHPPPVLKPRRRPARVVVHDKAGELHFRRLQVLGHLRQPRVDFTRDRLPLERADEPLTQDFYPKVFAPARDDDF